VRGGALARKQHYIRKTLLIVGEGDSEVAFLKHLRDLYCARGAGVTTTVKNAHGKGPDHVIDHTVRQAKIYNYDVQVALLDTDIPWTDKLKKVARKAKIEMIGSTPCFEGLLLSILGKRPAMQSATCKKTIQQLLDIDLTERHGYGKYFAREVLDSARASLTELDRLLKFFEGQN
jgi:hypothetical protein